MWYRVVPCGLLRDHRWDEPVRSCGAVLQCLRRTPQILSLSQLGLAARLGHVKINDRLILSRSEAVNRRAIDRGLAARRRARRTGSADSPRLYQRPSGAQRAGSQRPADPLLTEPRSEIAERKSRIAVAQPAGSSSWMKCPAWGNSTSRVPGRRWTIWWAISVVSIVLR